MSENYRLYPLKTAERRATRYPNGYALRVQLEELMAVVRRCEHIWKIEQRIESSLR